MSDIRGYANKFMIHVRKNPKRIALLLKGIALEDEDAREKMWEILQFLHMTMKMILNKLPVDNSTSDDLVNMLSGVTVTPAVNLVGKLDAIPEDQFESRVAFVEYMLDIQVETPFGGSD